MQRTIALLLIAFGVGVFAFWLMANSGNPLPLPSSTTTEDPISNLKRQIAQQEIESANAVSNYIPRSKTQIDDLGSPVFWKDADAGFGGCSQPNKQCSGFYGPGSDLKTQTNAWCRLEVWDGERSPRTYWSLGKAFFRESVYIKQAIGETCPFSGPTYQLMRNFLFAAALAQRHGSKSFGVVAIAPARKAAVLEGQIEFFRTTVLQSEFGSLIRLQTYERLIELLQQSGDGEATALATFLAERIGSLIP